MPLLPGSHPQIVAHNIKEMLKAGHPHDQAVAAALHNAGMRRSKKAKKIIDQHNAMTQSNAALVNSEAGSGAVGS